MEVTYDALQKQLAQAREHICELRKCLVMYVELDWPKPLDHKRARDAVMQTWEYKQIKRHGGQEGKKDE